MCVILICPPELRPDLATLEACHDANPHGAGIAWRSGGRVHFRKTDDVAEIHRLAKAAKGEVVIHFRIASIGAVCPELRHPFPVTKRAGLSDCGTAKAVLFQNGTWFGWEEAVAKAVRDGHDEPAGPMRDARAAAWLTHVYGVEYLRALRPSRWVLFGAEETVIHGEWRERGGIQFSNLHWCGRDTGIPPHLTPRPSTKPTPVKRASGTRANPLRVNLWGDQTDYWSRIAGTSTTGKK